MEDEERRKLIEEVVNKATKRKRLDTTEYFCGADHCDDPACVTHRQNRETD